MVRVGGEESPVLVHIQQGKRTDIETIIIVGQLQIGEHAPNQSTFAGAGIANNADQLVKRRQVLLRQLHAQSVHTLMSAGSKIGTDNKAFLAFHHGKDLPK